MDWTKAILNDIHYQKKVLSNPLTIALTRLWLIWNHSATLVAVIINLIIAHRPGGSARRPPTHRRLTSRRDDRPAPVPDAFFNTTGQWKADYPSLPDWLMAFAYILDALSIIILLGLLHLARLAWRLRQLRQKDQEEENEVRESGGQDKLSVRLFSIATFYYIVFVRLRAFAGTFYSPYFFAFHLLNIVNNNQMLRGVIQRRLSLVWVSVLGIAIMYLYAVIGFAKFRIAFRPDDSLMFCGTLYQCFVTILRFGLIGDLFENLVPPSSHRNFDEYVWMALFSITFFVLISTIGLNIIFGIIVDTFSQLRDKKWLAETDMRNCCFICSRNNYDFEHHGQGFDHHVRTEHNMWAYIFFFIHLEDTATNDYTSLDLHVHKMLKEERFEFFPLNRALCLSAKDEDSTDSKIDELLSNVKDLVQHQKEERPPAAGHRGIGGGQRKRQRRGVRIRGSHPAPDRRFLLSVPRPPHEEEDEDELPRSPSLPGSEEDYRLSVPDRTLTVRRRPFRLFRLVPPIRCHGDESSINPAVAPAAAEAAGSRGEAKSVCYDWPGLKSPRDDRAPISWKWSRVRVVAGCQARLTKAAGRSPAQVGAAVVAVELFYEKTLPSYCRQPMLRLCGLEPHRGCIGRLSGFAPSCSFPVACS
uniref:Ion_trans domain-containing protein n=1 Tax=Macrostomum lignano TaxID=282301 RepID=A0A1I8FRN0_9PLAT